MPPHSRPARAIAKDDYKRPDLAHNLRASFDGTLCPMTAPDLRPQLRNILNEWRAEKRSGFLVLNPQGEWIGASNAPAEGTPYVEVFANGEVRHHRNNGTGAFKTLLPAK